MTMKVGDNDVSSVPTVDVPSYADMKIAFHDPEIGRLPTGECENRKIMDKNL